MQALPPNSVRQPITSSKTKSFAIKPSRLDSFSYSTPRFSARSHTASSSPIPHQNQTSEMTRILSASDRTQEQALKDFIHAKEQAINSFMFERTLYPTQEITVERLKEHMPLTNTQGKPLSTLETLRAYKAALKEEEPQWAQGLSPHIKEPVYKAVKRALDSMTLLQSQAPNQQLTGDHFEAIAQHTQRHFNHLVPQDQQTAHIAYANALKELSVSKKLSTAIEAEIARSSSQT